MHSMCLLYPKSPEQKAAEIRAWQGFVAYGAAFYKQNLTDFGKWSDNLKGQNQGACAYGVGAKDILVYAEYV